MTVRTNVTSGTTKFINRNKFRNVSIRRGRSNHRFWFLPQQRTIWSKVTNNTTKMTCRHKNKFHLHSSSRFRLRFTNFFYVNPGFFSYYVKKPSFGLECVWLLIRKLLYQKKFDGSNVKWVCHHDMLDSWCRICFITYIYDNDG